MLKKYLLIILAVFFLFSCQEQKETGDVNIAVSFPALAGEKLYLEELEVRNSILLDSIVIPVDGQFNFQIEIQEAGFYMLRTTLENSIILQLEKGEKAIIASSESDFNIDYKVDGSPGSKLYQEFAQFIQYQKLRIDSLANEYYTSRGTENFLETKARLDSVYEVIFNNQKNYVINFIKEHPNALVTLIVINRKLGNALVLDEEEDFYLFHTIDSLLTLTYPNNKHVQDHHKRTKEIRLRIFDYYQLERKLLPGKKAPDIVLNDTSGEPHSLKSYLGKKVMVYFWAGWNAKSRQDNRKLVKIYESLKLKNIEIIGVSLDENEIVWKGALKLDKLQWLQLSNLGGLQSEIKKTYNIPDELPFYYVLDENHKIIGKGKELEEALKLLGADH